MKETIKTSRTAGYLEKIFRALNSDWFGGELEEPIITIQSTPRAYGHVTVSKIWKSKGDDRRHAIVPYVASVCGDTENILFIVSRTGGTGPKVGEGGKELSDVLQMVENMICDSVMED